MGLEEVNDRITALIEALGLKPNSFSVAIGVDAPTIHNIVKGRRSKPSFDVLAKILLAFDNINGEWLLVGKGEMFKDAHPEAHLKAHLNEPNAEYKAKSTAELEKEISLLKAQIEALYRAFRELGAANASDSKASKSA